MATSLQRDFVSLAEYFALDGTSSRRCAYRNRVDRRGPSIPLATIDADSGIGGAQAC
jgi:hypothetical protein